VTLVVLNKGVEPIYIYRLFFCSNLKGYFNLKILDKKDRDVIKPQCSADMFVIEHVDVSDAKLWVKLLPGETYSMDEEFELPQEKGPYRLVATLVQPGFSGEQKKQLLQDHLRVLQHPHGAPAFILTVK
jgi:hypothetical protein